jgi:hypothetical protein
VPSRIRELSRFAAAIWDFWAGTPGGEVVEEVRAIGDMAKECEGGMVGEKSGMGLVARDGFSRKEKCEKEGTI